MREICFDTETTGLDPKNGDKLIEIGCVEIVDRKITGNTYRQLINPGKANSQESVQITGITDEMLKDKPFFNEMAQGFLEFIGDSKLIAHNATFDINFINYELQEIARDINSLRDDTNFEEEERIEIEQRLDIIFSLKRKYGNTEEEILKYQKEIKQEIYEIENTEEENKKRREEQDKIKEKMIEIAEKLTKIRTKSAEKLSEQINKELVDLEMKQAKCNIKVEKKEEFDKNGLDDVEFLICTNIGDDEKPLIKIASGGEMSRIMLAIKSVLNEVDEVPVLIFDEIDTGISGKAAKAVGNKMKQIAKNHQILCITHLASIAAMGDYNYYIYTFKFFFRIFQGSLSRDGKIRLFLYSRINRVWRLLHTINLFFAFS